MSQTERTNQAAVAEEEPQAAVACPETEGPGQQARRGPSRKQRKEPVDLEPVSGLPKVDEEAVPLVEAPIGVLVGVAGPLLG